MALNVVTLNIQYYPDPDQGRPLFNASIYVGVPDTDPELPANQKPVIVRQEDGTDIPVAQPVMTGAGGVPMYMGSPVSILTDGNYSLKVLKASGAQAYYFPDAASVANLVPASAIFNERYIATDSEVVIGGGETVITLRHPNTAGSNSLSMFVNGARQFVVVDYTETDTTVTFLKEMLPNDKIDIVNGELALPGVTIDASVVSYTAPFTGAVQSDAQTKLSESVSVKDFGAVGDGVTDDGEAMQAASDASKVVFYPAGEYLTSVPINLPQGSWVEGEGAYQNTPSDRITKVNFTGTTGFAFQYVSPVSSSIFAGDFSVYGMWIASPNITDTDKGGCLLFGNTDLAGFSTYAPIGRVSIKQCYLTGVADESIGILITKVFDSDISENRIGGANYGLRSYGSDINGVINNRFIANGTHVRATVAGSFSGSLLLDHNDMLTATYCGVWLEGSISPILSNNYIEQVSASAIDSPQTGTITVSPYSTTLTGVGTTFTTQLAQTLFGGNRLRVLIKVGDEYRQVNTVTNDTTIIIDRAFNADTSGNSWSIIYGTGVIATSITGISLKDNRIDVTSANGTVPRCYFGGVSGEVSDVSGANALNGPIAIADQNPNTGLIINDGYKLDGPTPTDGAARFDFSSDTADGAGKSQLLDAIRANQRVRPVVIKNAIDWFEQGGVDPRLILAGADTNNTRSVTVANTSGAGDDLSMVLPESFWGKRLRIKIRVNPRSVASFIQFHIGASLGAKTTSLGSTTATPAGSWYEYEFCTKLPSDTSSSNKYLTVSKNTQIVYYDYVLIEAMDDNDFIFGTGTPEGVYTADIGAMFRRTNGGASTTLYVKESGAGNTGWIAK